MGVDSGVQDLSGVKRVVQDSCWGGTWGARYLWGWQVGFKKFLDMESGVEDICGG